MDGLLVLDKPGGMTSRAALDRASHWFPRGTRPGHTGTLDPLATGVLVLCLGSATRLAEYVQRLPKIYRSTFRLGVRSTTDDADGMITPVENAVLPALETVAAVLAGFVGKLEQVPPAFSAAKITGQRAYNLARTGHTVSLTARQVEVYGIDILSYTYPLLDVEIRCGKGTYVRSLARDLGERLGCGALVQTLRRLRVGPFTVDEAVTLDLDAETAMAQLRPPETAIVELPRVILEMADAGRLRHGQSVLLPVTSEIAGEVAVWDDSGRFVAIATIDGEQHQLRPKKVFSRP